MKKITLLSLAFLTSYTLMAQQKAIVFDGSDLTSKLIFNEDDSDTTGSTIRISENFTFDFWIKAASGETGYIFHNSNNTSTSGSFYVRVVTGKLVLLFKDIAGANLLNIETDGTVLNGNWHHVAIVGTYSSPNTTVVIYVDGSATTNLAASPISLFDRDALTWAGGATDPGKSTIFTIGNKTGGSSAGQSLEGEIDEFRTWTRALSAGEITSIASSCTQPSLTGFHRYLPFSGSTNEIKGSKTVTTEGDLSYSSTTDTCAPITLSVETTELANIKIHPNPVRDILNISGNFAIKQVEIIDLLGKQVFKSNKQLESMDLSRLSKGVYILKISSVNDAVLSKKIVLK